MGGFLGHHNSRNDILVFPFFLFCLFFYFCGERQCSFSSDSDGFTKQHNNENKKFANAWEEGVFCKSANQNQIDL